MGDFSFKNIKQCKLSVKYLTLLSLCFFVINCSSISPKITRNPSPVRVSENAININTASLAELEKLPHIGAKTAEKIVEYREQFGKFRRPEHLLLVGGISDKRFRKMRSMIKVK
jgi:competence protein ComEA